MFFLSHQIREICNKYTIFYKYNFHKHEIHSDVSINLAYLHPGKKDTYLSLPLHIHLAKFCVHLSHKKSNKTTIFNYAGKTIVHMYLYIGVRI